MEKTINRTDLITIRDYTDNDKSFIMATWLKGVYYGEAYFQDIMKAIWMENYRSLFDKFLTLPTTKIKVACLKEDHDIILGYSIYHTKRYNEESVTALDWVYVKAAWRNTGIGKSLLPRDFQAYTQRSKQGYGIVKAKFPQLIFNPFILF